MLGSAAKIKGRRLEGALSAKVIAAGLAREIRAKETLPIWRTDVATGRTYALKLTIKGEVASRQIRARGRRRRKDCGKATRCSATARRAGKRPLESSRAAPGADAKGPEADNSNARSEPRANSKLALLVGLLSSDRGATIEELVAATGWLPHTTRAALTRLRQRGFGFERFKGGEVALRPIVWMRIVVAARGRRDDKPEFRSMARLVKARRRISSAEPATVGAVMGRSSPERVLPRKRLLFTEPSEN